MLQRYPADHAGDVSYMRAISFAQQALAHSPDETQKAHAFYLLGAAHSILGDPLLWDLGSYYFETCVEASPIPHWRKAVRPLGAGNDVQLHRKRGVSLPTDLSRKMERLRGLAQ
jgi:hypothetical protein